MTRFPPLIILGYSEAAMFLRRRPQPDVSAIISIHGSREFGVEATAEHRLDLTFDDIDEPPKADPVAFLGAVSRKRWAEQNGLYEAAPTRADVASIIDFAEAIRNSPGMVLCHCHAGMSRAPAAALICLAVWKGAGLEAECVREIASLRQGAFPHPGLIRIADALLNRDGTLIQALALAKK